MAYLILNIGLLVLFIPAFFFGAVGVYEVFEGGTILNFIAFMGFSGYLSAMAVTCAVSIKHHYR